MTKLLLCALVVHMHSLPVVHSILYIIIIIIIIDLINNKIFIFKIINTHFIYIFIIMSPDLTVI